MFKFVIVVAATVGLAVVHEPALQVSIAIIGFMLIATEYVLEEL